MNTVITATAPNSRPMMSSKEIADLTGKAHKNIIRDIESMITEIEKDGSDLSHQAKSKGYTVERDNRGYVKIIHLDHSHTITLITGYDAKQRKKVVDRWLELEAKPALTEETPEMLAFRAIIALQGKLEVSEERGKLQAAMLEDAQPKAKALDTLAGMRGFHSLTQAAKSCSWPRDAFIEECNRIKWIYRDKAKEIWMGYSEKERAGYLDYKPFQYTNSDGKLIKKPQVVFTDKGLAKICEIFAKKEKPVPFTKTPAQAA